MTTDPLHQPPAADDAELEQRALQQLAALMESDDYLKYQLSYPLAWALFATIQFATRHPRFDGPTAELVKHFAADLQHRIAPDGALAIIAERGWSPAFDQPAEAAADA